MNSAKNRNEVITTLQLTWASSKLYPNFLLFTSQNAIFGSRESVVLLKRILKTSQMLCMGVIRNRVARTFLTKNQFFRGSKKWISGEFNWNLERMHWIFGFYSSDRFQNFRQFLYWRAANNSWHPKFTGVNHSPISYVPNWLKINCL